MGNVHGCCGLLNSKFRALLLSLADRRSVEVKISSLEGCIGIFLLIPKITDQTDILDRLLDRRARRSNRQHRAGRRAELRRASRAGARKGIRGENNRNITIFLNFEVEQREKITIFFRFRGLIFGNFRSISCQFLQFQGLNFLIQRFLIVCRGCNVS